MITVISVAYNSAGVILPALASVANDALVARIIVVDNASTDNTQSTIAARMPQVEVVASSTNIGYGCGCNLGLERVQTPYALLLNPDARMQEGALEALFRALEATPEAAIAAPLLQFENGEVYTSYKRDVFARERYGNGLDALPEGLICAPFVSGAVWLIRMEHWRKMGGFDPQIFLFYEDDDACLRLQKAGFSLLLVPDARATHALGKSSAPSEKSEAIKQYHLAYSRLYLERKYKGAAAANTLRLRLLVVHALKYLGACATLNRAKRARHRSRIAGLLKPLH